MKTQAVHFAAQGKVEIRERELPDPGPGEIQVRTVANGICMWEVSMFRGVEPPVSGPLGHEGIAVVTKVGRDVTGIKEGDYVTSNHWCTHLNRPAADAIVYARPPADPAVMFAEPPSCAVTAWYSFDLTPGDRVLLLGVGYMGLLNLQLLARTPLAELVVADVQESNLRLARELGATATINNGTPAGAARLTELKAQPFDLVIECTGAEPVLQLAGELTRPGGRLSIFAWHHGRRTVDMTPWHMRGLKVFNSAPSVGRDHAVNPMARAVRLLEAGVFDQRPLISHRHHWTDVQAALELGSGRPPGYRKGVLLFE